MTTTPDTPTAVAANRAPLDLLGQVTLAITIAEFKSSHLFTVTGNITVYCILGFDFLLQHGTVIDCKNCCVMMDGVKIPFIGLTQSNHKPVIKIQYTIKAYNTVVITGRSVQAIEVALPHALKAMTTHEVLINEESASIPKHLLFPRSPNCVTDGSTTTI